MLCFVNRIYHQWRMRSDQAPILPAYRVVAVYEDLYNADRALDTCIEVSRLLHQVCTFEVSLWNFRDLQRVPARAEAVQAGATAEMVIIASYGQGKLPPVLFRWISEWLPLRGRRAGILVALLARHAKSTGSISPKLSFFKQVARKARLEFCSDQGDLLGVNGQVKLISPPLIRPVFPQLNPSVFSSQVSLTEAVQLDYPLTNN